MEDKGSWLLCFAAGVNVHGAVLPIRIVVN